MDWRSVTFDWNRARAFLVTAEEGSLSAAARALGMAQPTLGRQVAALEEELGVTLFERVGRGLALTDAGVRLLDHVRRMGDAASAFSLTASGQAQSVEGHVAVTASEIYSHWLLPQVLQRLRMSAPAITVNLVASNDIRDLKRREADIAIRNTRPDQPDLIGKQVAQDHSTFFGTADYLDSIGRLKTPADIAKAQIIGFGDNGGLVRAMNARGIPVDASNFGYSATTHTLHWELARAGLGLGIGPCRMGDADPFLDRALPDWDGFRYPVWLVAHRELRTSARVRIVWELLAGMVPGLLNGTA